MAERTLTAGEFERLQVETSKLLTGIPKGGYVTGKTLSPGQILLQVFNRDEEIQASIVATEQQSTDWVLVSDNVNILALA